MGSGDWFRNILTLKKTKRKQLEHVPKKPNGSKHSNGASTKNVGRLTQLTEDAAATRIQCAFRSYKARKALRRLKGITRFRGLIEEGFSGKNQASSALSQIHFWSRIQTDIKARWLGMVVEGKARQKKIENQIKLDSKLHELEVEWHCGPETVEEILNRIHQREEAAAKRERAMAYSFSHQWRANTGQCFGQAYYDLSKEGWGWSWKERWIAVRPWENRFHARAITNKVETRHKTGETTTAANSCSKKVIASKPDGKVSSIHARKLSPKVIQETA